MAPKSIFLNSPSSLAKNLLRPSNKTLPATSARFKADSALCQRVSVTGHFQSSNGTAAWPVAHPGGCACHSTGQQQFGVGFHQPHFQLQTEPCHRWLCLESGGLDGWDESLHDGSALEMWLNHRHELFVAPKHEEFPGDLHHIASMLKLGLLTDVYRACKAA